MNRITEIAGHAEMSEKSLERYLSDRVRQEGGVSLKYSNPYQAGFPDRLLLMPGGRLCWVEVKSRGRKPRVLQLQRHEQLRLLGQSVYVADSREKIEEIINTLKRTKPC